MDYYNQARDLRDEFIIDDLLHLQNSLEFLLTKHIDGRIILTTTAGNSIVVNAEDLDFNDDTNNGDTTSDAMYAPLFDSVNKILDDQLNREIAEQEHIDRQAQVEWEDYKDQVRSTYKSGLLSGSQLSNRRLI